MPSVDIWEVMLGNFETTHYECVVVDLWQDKIIGDTVANEEF